MTDELRSALKRIDPMRDGLNTEPVSSDSARDRLEAIMSTPIHEAETKPVADAPKGGRRDLRAVWFAAAAAFVLVAATAGGVLALRGGTEPAADITLALSGGADDILASCMAVSADILKDMPVAFAGTVTGIEGETVTLDVDRWFTEGEATVVTVTAPAGLEALIGSVPFVVGEEFLVSAFDGTVNYCGFSGPRTPELLTVYETAFPS
ncbi:MAG TPA: hypothetical protein VLA29_02470 [Acidimicrobiia bacterium]|nr:hypothetical protein [Acidimicrobiia bacterium]